MVTYYPTLTVATIERIMKELNHAEEMYGRALNNSAVPDLEMVHAYIQIRRDRDYYEMLLSYAQVKEFKNES